MTEWRTQLQPIVADSEEVLEVVVDVGVTVEVIVEAEAAVEVFSIFYSPLFSLFSYLTFLGSLA